MTTFNDADLRLPPLMCHRYLAGGWRRQPAEETVREWWLTRSNLLVLSGRPGSGKSWMLTTARDLLRLASRDDETLLADFDLVRRDLVAGRLTAEAPQGGGVERRTTLFLDNYDSINSITGEQTAPPDLTELSGLLRRGWRIVLATRRSPDDVSDELHRQLANELRCSALGARTPVLMHLEPWTQEELAGPASGSDPSIPGNVQRYIARYGDVLSDDFRRPLVIKMLSRLPHGPKGNEPLSLAQLYNEYATWALTTDYDRRNSAFREAHKREILGRVAYDIFSGQRQTRTAAYSISHVRLAERVMEIVAQDPSLRGRSRDAGYEWTQDFIFTNHFLQNSEAGFPVGSREYRFVHPSFFEYFVAQEILARVSRNSSLGIRPEALSEATFGSMALYFVREYWSRSIESAISSIAQRRLSWTDRLLLLYTMETTDEFGDLLHRTDRSYFEDLVSALGFVKSQFIQKAIKYQLVVVGRYSAHDYVADVRQAESDLETAVERRLLRTGNADLTTALLRRLDLPALRVAMPIAIYRLGQMGSALALPRLLEIADDPTCDAQTRGLAAEAIARIRSRQEPEERDCLEA